MAKGTAVKGSMEPESYRDDDTRFRSPDYARLV